MIGPFKEEYSFLSNFHPAWIEMEDGILYPTSEHAFQAYKTNDLEERLKISKLPTPGQAKRAGRKVQLRDNWDLIKIDVMRSVLKRKFIQNEYLLDRLIDTGDQELVEVNTWNDTFWGVCKGSGQNNLGKLLMELRNSING